MRDVREDFPVLEKNPGLVYLDSACTSLKSRTVIDAEVEYYTTLGACGGRSSHKLGRLTSERIERSRDSVARFVGAKAEELVWTRNTTEGLNIVANALDYSKRRKVVTSVMEHHSVLLPFMRLREQGLIDLEILGCAPDGSIPVEKWENAVGKDTTLVVTHSWNNTIGTGQDVSKIAKIAHDAGALFCLDGAQGVPHHKTDSKETDFLCFSAHKMLGPTGIGALIIRRDLIGRLQPLMSGGGTVKNVSLEEAELMQDQTRFEAGIQHYGGMLGFEAACSYLRRIGLEEVEAHERALAEMMNEALSGCGASVLGPSATDRHGALFSFNLRKARPHDIALMLDKEGIALRSGFFCAQPAMEAIGAKEGAVRASAYIYNTKEDVRKLGEALSKIGQIYD